MSRNRFNFNLGIPWPTQRADRPLGQSVRAWLPSRGNVIFTLLAIALLLWGQSVGAIPGLAPASPSATVPNLINYQGRLTDVSGNPVPNGNYNMVFAFYRQETGGSPFWSESRTGGNAVPVANSLFHVMLGQLTSINASDITGDVWLGITVGTDAEMTPRERLASVPFAMQANMPESLVPSGTIVMWSGSVGSIPAGWALCDGTSGTPDLRDRFIVGAGSSYTVGATGGAAQVTLTVDQMPAHSHTGTTSNSGNLVEFSRSENHGTANRYGMGTQNSDNNWWQGAHTHTFTTGNAGGGQSQENRPPYFSLAFIMKL
jgi:microcystin-dependent protein